MFSIIYTKPNFNLSKRAAALCFLLSAIFLSANCRSEKISVPADTPTREVTDDLGRTLKIPQNIERAVSLAPNLTENIFAVGAGNKLVGVTSFCDYPAEAQKIEKIGEIGADTANAVVDGFAATGV